MVRQAHHDNLESFVIHSYGKQFIKVRDVKDYPRMVKPLNTRDLESFFLAEAAKLKTEILE